MKPSSAMISTLAARLGRYPPFDQLNADHLQKSAASLRIVYKEPGDVVFHQHGTPSQDVYIIHKGAIDILYQEGERSALAHVCDVGDVFGVRALLAKRNYRATARAREPTLLYVLPEVTLRALMKNVNSVALFFAADFAGDLFAQSSRSFQAIVDARRIRVDPVGYQDKLTVTPITSVLTCTPSSSIREAAQAMRENEVGSVVVVDEEQRPLGLMTDADLRSRVVAEGVEISSPVATVMSQPVVTLAPGASLSMVVSEMVRRRIHHLPVTEDGSPHSPVVGIVSERDVLRAQGTLPTVLLQAVGEAEQGEFRRLFDRAEQLLRRYLSSETNMELVSRVMSEINDTLVRRSIVLALRELTPNGQAPVPFCWLALGSEGREEQLLRTDQDNAIVYAHGGDPQFFLELGARVVGDLVKAGFSPCPGGVMARESLWNQPIPKWKERLSRWISAPDPKASMHTHICFDLRPVAGDFSLAHELMAHVRGQIQRSPTVMNFLAKHAVESPPPLGFFRHEIIERSGEHQHLFDIKARAMAPLANSARVMAYEMGLDRAHSTHSRWKMVGEADPTIHRLAEEASMAYEVLMRIRAMDGLEWGHDGRYIHIESLNTIERQTLRSTFSVVEDVRLMVNQRFHLNFIPS